jgi:hypothetical protein
MLDDHFYCNEGGSTNTTSNANNVSESYSSSTPVVQTSVPEPVSAPSSNNQTKEDEDEVLKELLAGIDL